MHRQILLVCFSAFIAAGYCQTACSPRVGCSNPCDNGATCPRYANVTNVECKPNYCNGECRAEFFRGEKNITARCALETCQTKQCPPRRMCVQEEIPCLKATGCIRRINVTCVLPPAPRPPTDCDAIKCSDGKRCEVEGTRRGPEARCVDFVPTTCEEANCDDGMRCEMRPRVRDNVMAARCILQRTNVGNLTDCSQLECEKGLECVVMNNRAKCAKPTPPESCDELKCGPGYNCSIRGKEGSPRAVCVETEKPKLPANITKKCEDMECPEGYECQLAEFDKKNFVPRCIPQMCPAEMHHMQHRPPPPPRRPPQNCRELVCGEDERCIVVVEREDDDQNGHNMQGRDRNRPPAPHHHRDGDSDENEDECKEEEYDGQEDEEDEKSRYEEEEDESEEEEDESEEEEEDEDEEDEDEKSGYEDECEEDEDDEEEREREQDRERDSRQRSNRRRNEDEEEERHRGDSGREDESGHSERNGKPCMMERPRQRARCVPIHDRFFGNGSGSGSGCKFE